jgi:tRNA-binding protein
LFQNELSGFFHHQVFTTESKLSDDCETIDPYISNDPKVPQRTMTSPPRKPETTFATFEALDIRPGRVTRCELFPEAKKPALKLWVDFGEPIGLLRSSAQLTRRYTPDSLVGTTVLAVINFPPRRIAGFESQILVLGVIDPKDPGDIVLVRPDATDTLGWPLG